MDSISSSDQTSSTMNNQELVPDSDSTNDNLHKHDTIPTDSPNNNDSNINKFQNPKDGDVHWLQKLLQKHSNDPRLQPHYSTLLPKYPILRDKALVLAPMVDQSDLPFRMLCRNYGTNLCFTPMINAKNFHLKPGFRKQFWDVVNGTPIQDRPLFVQLCGSDVDSLIYTIEQIINSPNSVDGIDLNCGCPQQIAKRGQYGAFLLEKNCGDDIVDIVTQLVKRFGNSIPISVKVRLLPSGFEDSLNLYQRLVDAGAAMLTIHGRTRLQKGLTTGHADWDAIKKVVDTLGHRIPIIANGSISNLDDVIECLQHTNAHGIMSSEAILEYPPVFTETGTLSMQGKRCGPGRVQLAREYLKLCELYPPEKGGQGMGVRCARAHLHRMLHKDLSRPDAKDIRNVLAYADNYDLLWKSCDDVQALHDMDNHNVYDEVLSWYMRHRIIDDTGVHVFAARQQKNKVVKFTELDNDAACCLMNMYGEEDDDYYDDENYNNEGKE